MSCQAEISEVVQEGEYQAIPGAAPNAGMRCLPVPHTRWVCLPPGIKTMAGINIATSVKDWYNKARKKKKKSLGPSLDTIDPLVTTHNSRLPLTYCRL